jgi:hypothetical protein
VKDTYPISDATLDISMALVLRVSYDSSGPTVIVSRKSVVGGTNLLTLVSEASGGPGNHAREWKNLKKIARVMRIPKIWRILEF